MTARGTGPATRHPRARRVARGRTAAALLAAVLAVALSACGPDEAPPAEVTGPFRPCTPAVADSAQPTASSQSTASTHPPPADATALPSISLPCFAGGPVVRLAALGRPAVLNLWASWCGPCRNELPVFQQLADTVGSQVMVLGVVTGDTREAAAAFAEDRKVTFPAVFDAGSLVQRSGVAPAVMPVTIFLDAHGRVRHVEKIPVPDLSTLEGLVRTYLGVPL